MKLAESTPFSDFIRNATPAEKEAVYAKVLDASTVRQLEVLAKASNERRSGVRRTPRQGGIESTLTSLSCDTSRLSN